MIHLYEMPKIGKERQKANWWLPSTGGEQSGEKLLLDMGFLLKR